VEPCRKLAAAMGDADFGFCLDAGNIYFVDERPVDFMGAFHRRIKHIHLKDYYVKKMPCLDPGTGWERSKGDTYLRDAIPGHGDVDYMRLMQLIKNYDYDGYFSLEYCGPEGYEYSIMEGVDNLTKYYEETIKEKIYE